MGAVLQPRMSPEDQKIADFAARFRNRLIQQVRDQQRESQVVLQKTSMVFASETTGTDSHSFAGSASGTLRYMSTSSEVLFSQSLTSRDSMETAASTVSLDRPEEGLDNDPDRTSLCRSLRSHSFIRDAATRQIAGEVNIDTAGLSVSLPGKVGCEDDMVDLQTTNRLMRTKRVHKNSCRARKVYAKRQMTSLEVESTDSEDSEERLSEVVMTAAERQGLLKVLQQHFIFSALQAAEHELIMKKVVVQKRTKAEVVCKKGERGTSCYIIISGVCSVIQKKTVVAELSAGHSFGELAMLYDVPRNATVVCASPTVTLCMIKGVLYRRTMARAREHTLNETVAFLSGHEVFAKLTLEEKVMLANALVIELYKPGDKIMSEQSSTNAEWMYLVEEGTVEVTDHYRNRSFVGPGALISGQKMHYGLKVVAATARSNVKCHAIGGRVIHRLFGNISEVLRCASVRDSVGALAFFRELTEAQQLTVGALMQEKQVKKGEPIVTSLADPQLVLVLEGKVAVIDDAQFAQAVREPDNCPPILDANSDRDLMFDSVCPKERKTSNPELEIPRSEGAGDAPLLRILSRGEVFGEETFCEKKCMAQSLVAQTDATICRVGYDELCLALRGHCEHTPPLSWILQRNRVKRCLQSTFPFNAVCSGILDIVVEAFQTEEFAPGAVLLERASAEDLEADRRPSVKSDHSVRRQLFLVIAGEAVRRCPGKPPEPLSIWTHFGMEEMILDRSPKADITAAASGCIVMTLTRERFRQAMGAVFDEVQMKMWYRQMHLELKDVTRHSVLGRGQFGTVHKVGLRGLEKQYALKRISKARVIELEQQSSIGLERDILQECCYPLVVRLISTFQDDVSVYLLMEKLGGGDLFTAIRDIGILNEEQILFFQASIVLMLEYIHSRGIIYRDLKTENIMLDDRGFLKLVDFGCCTRKARTYTFIGTPEYIAPEVIRGTGYSKQVDWWGAGVILYEMCCGPLPFGEGCSDPLDVFREILEKPLEISPRVQSEASDLVECLLERSPEQRLGSSTVHWKNEVRRHPFFQGLQWDAIVDLSIVPPYAPGLDEEEAKAGDADEAGEETYEPPAADADVSCFEHF